MKPEKDKKTNITGGRDRMWHHPLPQGKTLKQPDKERRKPRGKMETGSKPEMLHSTPTRQTCRGKCT